ncbi:MAG: phage major capsid protein [Chloroflexi bacterium]|nr:phage major capsid protein [Chloroflexota bacterium]
MNARDLRDKRAGLKVEAQTLLDVASKEARDLTVEERAKFDELSAKIDGLAEDVRRAEKMAEYSAEPKNPIAAEIGMTKREVEQYSIVRAIRAAASAKDDPRAWEKAGLEREASDAVAKRFGREPRSFFIPHDVMVGSPERRDMTVGTPTAGGYLVQTTYPLSMIELLRNKMILAQAGITMLTGLVGDVAVPKHTAAGTGYWVAENGAPSESAQTIGQVTLTPHTFGAYSDISHKLLIQSSLDVEGFVRDDLARVIALGIDYAGLHGDDSADVNQPDGVASTSGIGSVVGGTNGAAPDWADVVNLEKEVAIDNAEVDKMAYITNAAVRGKLKQTMRTATYGEIPIWGDNNILNGHPALVSNQVSSTLTKGSSNVASAIFYGNWAELVMGMWGQGVDILVDPYSLSTQRAVRVVAFQDVDFAVRHAQSFAAMLDALTA